MKPYMRILAVCAVVAGLATLALLNDRGADPGAIVSEWEIDREAAEAQLREQMWRQLLASAAEQNGVPLEELESMNPDYGAEFDDGPFGEMLEESIAALVNVDNLLTVHDDGTFDQMLGFGGELLEYSGTWEIRGSKYSFMFIDAGIEVRYEGRLTPEGTMIFDQTDESPQMPLRRRTP